MLRKDASDLYGYWATSYKGGESYAVTFKNHGAPFNSAGSCVQQVIDGCVDIANEVGETKIGDPYSKYQAGKVTEASMPWNPGIAGIRAKTIPITSYLSVMLSVVCAVRL